MIVNKNHTISYAMSCSKGFLCFCHFKKIILIEPNGTVEQIKDANNINYDTENNCVVATKIDYQVDQPIASVVWSSEEQVKIPKITSRMNHWDGRKSGNARKQYFVTPCFHMEHEKEYLGNYVLIADGSSSKILNLEIPIDTVLLSVDCMTILAYKHSHNSPYQNGFVIFDNPLL